MAGVPRVAVDTSFTAPVIFLMGPTATGKTDIAVRAACELPVDIVSVDSAMVYRGLDIGTGKPEAHVLAVAPHALIDIRDPAQRYSAAEFRDDALAAIARIHDSGRIPLLVGGTGLYFRALREGLADLPPADHAVRADIDAEAVRRGWAAMHAELARVDPLAARRIHPNDPQRIQRGLEVHRLTGRALSEHLAIAASGGLNCPLLVIVLEAGHRESLYQRISQRFHEMLSRGLESEVERLRVRGDLDLALPAIRSVGYRQVWEYLDGLGSRERMVERAVAATRQLAKRQLTWLRRESASHRFDSEDCATPATVVRLIARLVEGPD